MSFVKFTVSGASPLKTSALKSTSKVDNVDVVVVVNAGTVVVEVVN